MTRFHDRVTLSIREDGSWHIANSGEDVFISPSGEPTGPEPDSIYLPSGRFLEIPSGLDNWHGYYADEATRVARWGPWEVRP